MGGDGGAEKEDTVRTPVEHVQLKSLMEQCHAKMNTAEYSEIPSLTIEVNCEMLLSMMNEIHGARFMRKEGLWVDCSPEKEAEWQKRLERETEHLIP